MRIKSAICLLLMAALCLMTSCGEEAPANAAKTDDASDVFLSCMSESSYVFNTDLALICARLSQEIENVYVDDDVNKIKDEYKKLGVKEENIYTLPDNHDSYYYSLACMEGVNIDNKNYNILFITARGTAFPKMDEITADAFAESNSDFFGHRAYDDSYYFYTRIQDQIENKFLNDYPFLKTGNLKVVITGHSLGGSGANLVAAAFDHCLVAPRAWWSDLTTQDDIYCYTFGGIGSVDLDYGAGTNASATIFGNIDPEKIYDDSIINGYENIHNLYNYYDSFGPHGNKPLTVKNRNSTYYNKFGHPELFGNNDYWASKYNDDGLLEFTQHSLDTYKDALNDPAKSGLVTCHYTKPTTKTTKTTETKPQVTSAEPAPAIDYDEFIIGLWGASDGTCIDFYDDGVFYFDWGYGIEEEGYFSVGQPTGPDSFMIDMEGTSLLLLMQMINGVADDTYHFEVLIQDYDNIYLVQVYGDKTAKTSPCKLPLERWA